MRKYLPRCTALKAESGSSKTQRQTEQNHGQDCCRKTLSFSIIYTGRICFHAIASNTKCHTCSVVQLFASRHLHQGALGGIMPIQKSAAEAHSIYRNANPSLDSKAGDRGFRFAHIKGWNDHPGYRALSCPIFICMRASCGHSSLSLLLRLATLRPPPPPAR
jgi:hypothetical protein